MEQKYICTRDYESSAVCTECGQQILDRWVIRALFSVVVVMRHRACCWPQTYSAFWLCLHQARCREAFANAFASATRKSRLVNPCVTTQPCVATPLLRMTFLQLSGTMSSNKMPLKVAFLRMASNVTSNNVTPSKMASRNMTSLRMVPNRVVSNKMAFKHRCWWKLMRPV